MADQNVTELAAATSVEDADRFYMEQSGADKSVAGALLARVGKAQTFTGGQKGTITTLTDGATVTANLAVNNNFKVTLGGNRTLSFSNIPTAGQDGWIDVIQGTGAPFTLSYDATCVFNGGTAPVLGASAEGGLDRLVYSVDSNGKVIVSLGAGAVSAGA